MSYPDLGCFAECLRCELCDQNWLNGDDIDLDLPDDYDDGWNDDFGLGDWEPDPDEGGFWDDFDIPGAPLPGGGEATPDWNDGPSIKLTWPI